MFSSRLHQTQQTARQTKQSHHHNHRAHQAPHAYLFHEIPINEQRTSDSAMQEQLSANQYVTQHTHVINDSTDAQTWCCQAEGDGSGACTVQEQLTFPCFVASSSLILLRQFVSECFQLDLGTKFRTCALRVPVILAWSQSSSSCQGRILRQHKLEAAIFRLSWQGEVPRP